MVFVIACIFVFAIQLSISCIGKSHSHTYSRSVGNMYVSMYWGYLGTYIGRYLQNNRFFENSECDLPTYK